MSRPIVHVIDDDASFLRSVTRLLRASGYEVAVFCSAEDFLEQRDPAASGCVVTDLQMPRRSGLDLQEVLARSGQSLPMIFLTAKGDIPTTVQAMRAGAEDFLTKCAPKERLISAIERALKRNRLEAAQGGRRSGARRKLKQLTTRELQVLGRVLRGLMNKQIADELDIAERTAKHHRSTLMRKLGVQSVAELVLLVREAQVDPANFAPSPSTEGRRTVARKGNCRKTV